MPLHLNEVKTYERWTLFDLIKIGYFASKEAFKLRNRTTVTPADYVCCVREKDAQQRFVLFFYCPKYAEIRDLCPENASL